MRESAVLLALNGGLGGKRLGGGCSTIYPEFMRYPYFLGLAYDGTDFHGWQIQSVLPTVQGTLWRAVRALDRDAPLPQGTGRTDAGVHADAQGVLVLMERAWEPFRLLSALNAHLPGSIRVMEVKPVEAGFYPRRHAVAKRYRYRLGTGPAAHPMQHRMRWHLFQKDPLDREAMEGASKVWCGTLDFSSFRHQECVADSPIRIIHEIRLEPNAFGLDLVFEGSAFLMHQIRIMTGTLVQIGKGRLMVEDARRILLAKMRSEAGETAPPHGLCLEKVWYESQWGIGDICPWPEVGNPSEE